MHNYGSHIQAVLEALAAGKLIDAIKLTREHTGLDLRGAKDLVEAAMAGCGRRAAERQQNDQYGVFYVIDTSVKPVWTYHTRAEAEREAKVRATADHPQTVVKAISKTSVKVEVTPI